MLVDRKSSVDIPLDDLIKITIIIILHVYTTLLIFDNIYSTFFSIFFMFSLIFSPMAVDKIAELHAYVIRFEA